MDESSFLVVNSRIAIPRRELRFSFVRSSGPGGQNVNKVNSKAVLRWAVRKSPSLPEEVRERFLKTHCRRINARGELILKSQRYRDRARNVEDCLNRLATLVRDVSRAPRTRRKTRTPRRAVEARLHSKQLQAQKKSLRRQPRADD